MAPKKSSGSKLNAAKKQIPAIPGSEHIVFEGESKKRKGKTHPTNQESSSEPPKPTARQIVGGASWTGKLPVNLLSEHCQRQKWNKPDYSMRQIPARDGNDKLYRSDVTISKTDPRTRETITLPPFRLPPNEIQLADQPSALEARHFAATYALFRIQSMKSIHMTLPPNFRDLWKGKFSELKKQDVDEGHGWKYDEDPFAAETKRQEIHKAMDKRKAEDQKRLELQSSLRMEGPNSHLVVPVRDKLDKSWEHAPQAVMGHQIRLDVEELIRKHAAWNPYDLRLTKLRQDEILVELSRLGFRESHVQEALSYCQDQHEALEWLLVHIPEDDLPKWTFPSNYNAGIILASGDSAKEVKLRRLASAGYPTEFCAQALRNSGGDENRAAFRLQESLVASIPGTADANIESISAWKEETETLTAIFGDNLATSGGFECSISMSTTTGNPFTVHFRCPQFGYPHTVVPAIAVEMEKSPAYVRLSATKRAVQYAQAELLGEVMMYNICQWLETEIPNIIEDPGKLSDLRIQDIESNEPDAAARTGKRHAARERNKRASTRHRRVDTRSDTAILEHWKARQATPAQSKMVEARKRLPAWAKQDEILHAIHSKQVTIISGETGSGKSTQAVQFVLDHAIQNLDGSKINILCTQPRRVAALSLADRVSNERYSSVGDEVGYIIRGESKLSSTSKITFMTTGVLLRRLQAFHSVSDALVDVSHIFIDEVHERSLDTDFLLALLKECTEIYPKIKIVLMSATLDAGIFSNYFGGKAKVAIVNIEGRTFPVTDVHLEEIMKVINPALDGLDIGKAISGLGTGINYDLIRDLVLHIDNELGSQVGSILIFLPGTMEIDRCLRALSGYPQFLSLPLHASLLPAEQRQVFPPSPLGWRKIVAATNVAETSITIEDVVAVIDTGKVKETSYDVENNIVRLEETWASQAACKQRRGRAGRVRAGICYKLFTRNVEMKMPPKPLPEIQRVPLEQLCLSVKATGTERDVADFLSKTLTPPDSEAISNAIKTLHIMNALDKDRLTALGTYLATIPADLRCAKLLVYGTLFECLEPCLTIASVLTVRSPFVSPRAAREEANTARLNFSSADGDLILDMRAFDEWNDLTSILRHGQLAEWCSARFISNQTMRDIASTRRQLLDSLKEAGLVPFRYQLSASQKLGKDPNQLTLLTALIAAALQPQLAVIAFPSKKYIASISGAKELDPEAKTIKFFVPDSNAVPMSNNSTPVVMTPNSSRPSTPMSNARDSTVAAAAAAAANNETRQRQYLSRVFVHPGSCLFSAQTFPRHSTHLSYFTKMVTSKPFVRDLTPLNIYSLLMFGGKLEVDTAGRGLIVGGIWKVQGWARIGVLISRLRVLLDEELRKSIEGGGVLLGSMSSSRVVDLVRRLLVLNGQDQ